MTIRGQLQDLEGEIVRCVAGLGYGATADGGAIGGAEGGAKSPDEAAPFFGGKPRCCIRRSCISLKCTQVRI